MRVLLFILVCLFSSCITQEKCLRKFPPETITSETITKEVKDTTIEGRSVNGAFQIDPIGKKPIAFKGQKIVYGKPVIIKDTSGKLELKIWLDRYGNLAAECASKDELIKRYKTKINKAKTTEKVHTVEERYIPWWIWVIIGVLFFAALPKLLKMVKISVLGLK